MQILKTSDKNIDNAFAAEVSICGDPQFAFWCYRFKCKIETENDDSLAISSGITPELRTEFLPGIIAGFL